MAYRSGGEKATRRRFMQLLGVAGATGAVGIDGSVPAEAAPDDEDSVGTLSFYSTASQIAADGQSELTDESVALVRASKTATNVDREDSSDDAVIYEETAPPLVSEDDGVYGIGTVELVADGNNGFQEDTEQFLANCFEAELGDEGTIAWDESHGQRWTLDEYATFERYGADEGYDLRPSTNLLEGTESLTFPSTASQAAPGGDAPLTDPEQIVLWAEPTAENVDNEDDGAYLYEEEPIPLVSKAGAVVGFGAPELFADGTLGGANEQFLLNILAETVDPEGTILWDDGHDTFYDSSGFTDFADTVEAAGYTFEATTDIIGGDDQDPVTIEEADLLAVASPSEAYTDEELEALETHVSEGGALFLFDESEFTNEETANLNAIAAELALPFSFNPDQVEDGENNAGQSFVPTTTNYNDAFDLFDGIGGIGIDEADALVVTSPARAFTDEELAALSSFVDGGGALFLFDQSEFNGLEETANLNAVADAIDLSFRFNGDQVEDEDNNTGAAFDVATSNYDPDDDRFLTRANGIGIDFEPGGRYPGRVVEIADGDTFDVELQDAYGQVETVRHLGIDTAETGTTPNELNKWFGIEDESHVDEWGTKATEYALDRMAPEGAGSLEPIEGRQVVVEIDENADSARGNFGRLLTYVYYDPEAFEPGFEAGTFEANYNREIVEDGYARVYSSDFADHDEWARAEARALSGRQGVWSAADFQSLTSGRNDPVETAFVPRAEAITAADGPLPDEYAVVTGSASAEADVEEDRPALIAVDEQRRVGAIGGLFLREDYYESGGEEYPEPVGTQPYPLAANLVDYLSEGIGPVLVDGGHGQFEAAGAVGLEDAQFFAQYLERIGTRLRQSNDLPETLDREPVRPRAVVVTPPADSFTREEIERLRAFRDDGGAVVLVGSALADEKQRSNLNELAAALGTALRVSGRQVTDPESNVGDDPALVTTSAFDESVPLYDPADLAGDHVTTYLRSLAGEDDRIDIDGLQTAIGDWRDGIVDTPTLLTAVDAWREQTSVF